MGSPEIRALGCTETPKNEKGHAVRADHVYNHSSTSESPKPPKYEHLDGCPTAAIGLAGSKVELWC